LGNALVDAKDFNQALVNFDQALKINPQNIEVYFNRAVALQALLRTEEAIQNLDLAITLQPTFADAYNNRGVALLSVRRYEEALQDFDHSLKLTPHRADAYVNRGNALRGLKKNQEALMSYQKALELNPEFDYLFGTWFHLKMKLCDWSDFESNRDKLKAGILAGNKISIPFAVLSLIDDSSLHLKASKIYHQNNEIVKKLPKNIYDQKLRKIRIGYYSADFREHATSYLIAGLIESHDKNKFEIYGFSFGPHVVDAMHARLLNSFDQLFEVSKMNDQEVIDLSRNIGIDIAIDLKGDTEDARVGLFTGRCAPVQVNYLGYPGSMGLDCYDYILADKVVLPEKNYSHYSEKVVSLLHSYQVNDSHRHISDRVFTKTELGLPEEGFIFCCFNNSYKILPQTFDLWMEILKNVEGSVLWLYSDTLQTVINLKREAEARGILSQRLIFAVMMPHAEHLARHRCADLFLDTLPYNAHTTASDALWAGLPVLTCMGESFASRVAASLLSAVNLEELIETDPTTYVQKAIEIAQSPEKMIYLKNKLKSNLPGSHLFNTDQFTKNIEISYFNMINSYQN
jgi:predicted O-linked N-acetylglucosamine transferase (SPINDLY family)